MFLVYRAARMTTNMVTVMMTNASNNTPWYAHAARKAAAGSPTMRSNLGHVHRPLGGSSR